MSYQQNVWIQNPFANQEVQINNMDPNIKSPEDKERLDALNQEFNSKYRSILEQGLWEDWNNLIWKIAGQFEIQDWDIDKAIEVAVKGLNLEQWEKVELITLIQASIEEDSNTSTETNKQWNDNSPETKEESTKIEEHPYSPIINSFKEKWLLAPEEAQLVKKALSQSENPFDNSSNIWDLLDNVDIDKEKKDKIIEAITFLEKPETKEENRKDFEQDFETELEGFKVEIDWELSYDNITEITIESLWSSYFTERGESSETSPEKIAEALNLAFEVSLDKTIHNKNINRNERFEELVRTIKDPDQSFKSRLESLIKLTQIVETEQWAKWKNKREQNERFKKQGEVNNLNLQERFKRIKELLKQAKENGDKELQKKALKKAKILEQEASENNPEWEILQLSGWQGDILSQIDSLLEKKQA